MDHPDSHHGGAAIQHLRRAAAARVKNRSLRHVASQTGMSAAGLKTFLGGRAYGRIGLVRASEDVDEPPEDFAPSMHPEKPGEGQRDP